MIKKVRCSTMATAGGTAFRSRIRRGAARRLVENGKPSTGGLPQDPEVPKEDDDVSAEARAECPQSREWLAQRRRSERVRAGIPAQDARHGGDPAKCWGLRLPGSVTLKASRALGQHERRPVMGLVACRGTARRRRRCSTG